MTLDLEAAWRSGCWNASDWPAHVLSSTACSRPNTLARLPPNAQHHPSWEGSKLNMHNNNPKGDEACALPALTLTSFQELQSSRTLIQPMKC